MKAVWNVGAMSVLFGCEGRCVNVVVSWEPNWPVAVGESIGFLYSETELSESGRMGFRVRLGWECLATVGAASIGTMRRT